MEKWQLDALVMGAHAAQLDEHLIGQLLDKMPGLFGGSETPAQRLAVVGAVDVMRERFPELAAWDAQEDLLAAADEVRGDGPQPDSTWNNYYVGRFRVSGADEDLGELVRRAKHSDGSTVAFGTSADALSLLTSAAAANTGVRARLAALQFNPGNIRMGNFPHGTTAAFTAPKGKGSAPVPAHRAPVRAARAIPPAAAPPAPARAARAIAPAAASRDSGRAIARDVPEFIDAQNEPMLEVDETAGRIIVRFAAASLPMSAASALQLDIVRALRRLTVPREGFQWLDDPSDPAKLSLLVLHDTGLIPGLPPFEGREGGSVAGDVRQLESGTYTARIIDGAGSHKNVGNDHAGPWEAKHAVCVAIRGTLPPE